MCRFNSINKFTAFIALLLFTVLLLCPSILFMLFGIENNSSASFISRRASMLFLGLAVLLWSSRHAENSETRQTICLSMVISMFALALLGLFELVFGQAELGILLAVSTEVLIATLYLKIWLDNRHVKPKLIADKVS